MVFCAALRRDLVFLLWFPFLSHDQIFLCEILRVCRLKGPYNYFSSHFFLVIVVLLIFILLVLFLVAVISLYLIFFMKSLRRLIDVSMLSSMLASLLPPFSDTYLWNIRPDASSLYFFFSGPFAEVLPSSTLRIVPSILRWGTAQIFDEISAI